MTGICWVEARDSARHLMKHKTVSQNKNYPAQHESSSIEAEKFCSRKSAIAF